MRHKVRAFAIAWLIDSHCTASYDQILAIFRVVPHTHILERSARKPIH